VELPERDPRGNDMEDLAKPDLPQTLLAADSADR
jgi:hypothetical protein